MSKVKCQRLKVFHSLFILVIITFISSIFPNKLSAAFEGGINIGDHYRFDSSEFEKAADSTSDNGWVYLMMEPHDVSTVNNYFNDSKHSNLKLLIRGHYPGVSLTEKYAKDWATELSKLDKVPKPIYFVPVNEPNNPSESNGGIPASTVKSYISALKDGLKQNNLSTSEVKLLSPAMDVYNLADKGTERGLAPYIKDLGGWNFFNQFEGIALNLYGEYEGSSLSQSSPPIKKGQGYRQFLQSHFGANTAQAQQAKIFAVETGVKKIGERVMYKENSAEIVDYFSQKKTEWGNDTNFVMFSIFSYDPSGSDRNPWIYSDSNVLTAMNLRIPSVTDGSSDSNTSQTESFSNEYEITKNANRKLLPRTKVDELKVIEKECTGIKILGVCIFGNKSAELARETDFFQPFNVSKSKVYKAEEKCSGFLCNLSNLISNIVSPQTEKVETGALNEFRPRNLQFSDVNKQANLQDNKLAQATGSGEILGEGDSDEKRVSDSYKFTMKMILPRTFGSRVSGDISPIPTSTEPFPSTSPGPTGVPYPTPSGPIIASGELKDPNGSPALKNLIFQVSSHYFVPPPLIASLSWIEGAKVWYDSNEETLEYLKEGVRHPDFSWGAWSARVCAYNPWLASGPMQFTTGQWEPPPPAYKNSVQSAPGQANRSPVICNLMDSFWAAGNKLKTDSGTAGQTSLVWNKQAVGNAGWRYYGNCGRCPGTPVDPPLQQTSRAGSYDKPACNRFKKIRENGMSYCEYMWLYYQCNEKSSTSSEFFSCIGGKRP